MFSEYFQVELALHPLYTNKTKTTKETYKGIVKQDFPKWEGWRLIKLEKSQGTHISEITNEKLHTLVKNFYYVKYIELNY